MIATALRLFSLASMLFFSYGFSAYAFAYSTGVSTQVFYDTQRQRSLTTLVFYPTNDKTPETYITRNHVFSGYYAIPQANIAQAKFPLLLIAHGSGGNNTSQSFLATTLAKQGFIVIAANHPESTTGDSTPQGIAFWQQTEDLRFILTKLLIDNPFTPYIDETKIGVAGHSKGGISTLQLAGAQLDLAKMVSLCHNTPQKPNCYYYNQYINNGYDLSQLDKEKFNASYIDNRFRYFIALDPGGSTDPEYQTFYNLDSLKTISKPVFLVGAEYYRADQSLTLHNRYLDSLLNPAYVTYFEPKGSTHFSYLSACTEAGKKILDEEGEPFVCLDNRDRTMVQKELTEAVLTFIQQVQKP